MTKSLYVIGGAGSGKSTFMAALVQKLGLRYGGLEDLHSARNAKAMVTLRGHRLYETVRDINGRGMYLGVQRDRFPGSDGLDRASSPVAEEWIKIGSNNGNLPEWILGEGATLATRRFLYALHDHTDMMLIHLHVDPMVADLRFLQRGSEQDETFVKNTVTRSANLLRDMNSRGCRTVSANNSDRVGLEATVSVAESFLREH